MYYTFRPIPFNLLSLGYISPVKEKIGVIDQNRGLKVVNLNK